ncbi:MAG: TldD/PmbA family protein [Gemmatimonadales bacterium]
MSITRREFIKDSSFAAAALASVPRGDFASSGVAEVGGPDAVVKELCLVALDTARAAGASYADIRVMSVRRQSVSTRDDRVSGLSDDETFGFAIRALVGGAWGFVASNKVNREECNRVARLAVEQARINQGAMRSPVVLAPVNGFPDASWNSPIQTDPFDVPVEDKIGLLLAANAEALKVNGARFVNSSMSFVREKKTFGSTEGSIIEQKVYRSIPAMTVTAVAPDFSDFQSRSSTEIAAMGLGYEHVVSADLLGRAGQWAEEAVQKLSAKSVEAGKYDLILDPTNLFLTIHESIGHPTELDRALGYEANYAGTSFLSPPEEVIGKLQYGPESMNIQGDRTQLGALATVGWDDDGVPADSWPIVKDGIFVDYQTTREQAGWIAQLTNVTRSHGCSYASSWDRVQFQRMPNVSLMPGEDDLVLSDLIQATDRGIVIKGRGSYSIDQQRYNFQFGGQVFYEVRGGKITGMLKDAAYRGQTLDFWRSMDMLGGPRGYFLGGTPTDGKGQPTQANAVSHGCPPARFSKIDVINTAG